MGATTVLETAADTPPAMKSFRKATGSVIPGMLGSGVVRGIDTEWTRLLTPHLAACTIVMPLRGPRLRSGRVTSGVPGSAAIPGRCGRRHGRRWQHAEDGARWYPRYDMHIMWDIVISSTLVRDQQNYSHFIRTLSSHWIYDLATL